MKAGTKKSPAKPVKVIRNGKPKIAKRKVGAPSIKTPAMRSAICEGIALGKSARSMCIELGISQRALWNWLDSDQEFMQQYIKAKELSADVHFEAIIDIADDASNDVATTEDGREVTNHEAIARSRLRVDARKWVAARLAPKKYGERTTTAIEGGDPDKPILSKIEIVMVSTKSVDN